MSRLLPCPTCHAHVRSDERECPHCGATLRSGHVVARASAVVMTLALTACPAEALYGIPDTTAGTTGSTSDATETDGDETDAQTGSGSVSASSGTADGGTATDDEYVRFNNLADVCLIWHGSHYR